MPGVDPTPHRGSRNHPGRGLRGCRMEEPRCGINAVQALLLTLFTGSIRIYMITCIEGRPMS